MSTGLSTYLIIRSAILWLEDVNPFMLQGGLGPPIYQRRRRRQAAVLHDQGTMTQSMRGAVEYDLVMKVLQVHKIDALVSYKNAGEGELL